MASIQDLIDIVDFVRGSIIETRDHSVLFSKGSKHIYLSLTSSHKGMGHTRLFLDHLAGLDAETAKEHICILLARSRYGGSELMGWFDSAGWACVFEEDAVYFEHPSGTVADAGRPSDLFVNDEFEYWVTIGDEVYHIECFNDVYELPTW